MEASIGGKIHEQGETADQLFASADRKMYEDKMKRALAKYHLNSHQEEILKMCSAALQDMGIPDLRAAQKVLDAIAYRYSRVH